MQELNRWIKTILFKIPGKIGCKIRNTILPYKCGQNVYLWEDGFIEFPTRLTIGNGSAINREFFMNARGTITIGNNVIIGPQVMIYSTNHVFSDLEMPICKQSQTDEPVVIEDDIWIGARCTILPGVRIGKGSVIGAGSVVTKNVEPYSVMVGVPAEKIRSRA